MEGSRTLAEAADKLGAPRGSSLKNELTKRGLTEKAREIREKAKDSGRRERVRGKAEKQVSNSYSYDEERDLYTFHLLSLREPYRIDGESWRGVCFDYPKAGNDMTRGAIALKYDVPRPILEVMLRTYGLYKVDPEYSHEEMAKAETDEQREALAEKTLERKKHEYLVVREKKERAELKREVLELRGYRDSEKRWLEAACEAAQRAVERAGRVKARAQKTKVKATGLLGDAWAAMAPISDHHAGKFSWGRETWGGDYDTSISAARLREQGEATARLITSVGGRCERAYLPDAGDLFNGLDLQTEAGTPQEQDGRAWKVWEETFDASVDRVETVRRVADEVYVLAESDGNHDHRYYQFFYFALKQYFRGCPDVTVRCGPRHQGYFLHGRSIHAFDHGKGLPKNLDSAAAKLAAQRVMRGIAGDDFYDARYRYFYSGHLHEESMATEDRMRLYRLPPLCEQSDYEVQGRYSNEPAARFFGLDRLGRPVLDYTTYPGSAAG